MLTFYLARRFLRTTSSEKNINVMIYVCFIALSLSSLSLALVAAIMHGFEEKTYAKLQSIHPDITISSSHVPLNYEKIKELLVSEFSSQIDAFTPFSIQSALIADAENAYTLVTLMAIDISSFQQVMNISYTPERFKLETLAYPNTIAAGSLLTNQLTVGANHKLQLWYLQDELTNKKASFDQVAVTLQAIFKTGIDEFDARTVLVDRTFFDTLFPYQGVNYIGIKTFPHINKTDLATLLKKRLHMNVYQWQELYPGLLAALTLEKYVAVAVLGLMTLVASTTLIALMFMYVSAKRKDIALLRMLGMTMNSIKKIFILMGMGVTLVATISGLAAAAFISYLLEHHQLIKIPDVYYTSYVPAHLTWWMVMGILCFMTAVSFVASFISVHLIRTKNIAHLLKFDD